MTKAEHIAKFINEFYEEHSEKIDEEASYQELFEGGFKYLFREEGYNTVTVFNGESIDIADIVWDYNRLNDHMSYHAEIDGQVIGVTGWYDSWQGSEIDDKTVVVGKLRTTTYTTFHG